ncbi:VOC family protein [Pseudoduganella armeniaca]|uniref:VOC family protein n=1 Tax=Pseudoduganella armeniaca TaxID=2072590 RepID=A0A2R4CGR1_9BURK|nr:VOC family protein [Pseudoduganella armeniaca]AVR98775.1 VOC family protein [Pseudoduganella armeniaca]
MQLIPTVYFPGFCDEAIAFYQSLPGCELLFVRRIGDCIDPSQIQPGTEQKILRAALRFGPSVVYMSDGHGAAAASFQGFSLSVTLPSVAQAERVIAALADGGKVLLPPRPTGWAGTLGVLLDRFGVHWTVEATG